MLWALSLCYSTVTEWAEVVFADLVLLSTVFTHTAHPGLVLLNWLTSCNAHGKLPFSPKREKKAIRQLLSTKMFQKRARLKKHRYKNTVTRFLQQHCISLTTLKCYFECERTHLETGRSPEPDCPLVYAWWRSLDPGPHKAAAVEAPGSLMTPVWWRPASIC